MGYGNIGRCALEAVEAASDMECVGIVRRTASAEGFPELSGYKVVSDVTALGRVDVAILSVPSRSVCRTAVSYLGLGINTVDCFDIHQEIPSVMECLDPLARQKGAVSIIAAGWDPGSDSVVRALMMAMSPKGLTYTNFGPGRSMGHSVAAKAVEGVRDALSVTIPMGTGVHRRMVYVELEEGADIESVSKAVTEDPYFVNDETFVIQVPCVADLSDVGHGVNMVRKGVSGKTHNQMFEFNMKINNPALTAQIMVCAARASMKQRPGCHTMIEVPVIDLLEGERDELIKRLV